MQQCLLALFWNAFLWSIKVEACALPENRADSVNHKASSVVYTHQPHAS